MTYKNLFQFAIVNFVYKIFHGRILGNIHYTSEKVRTKDAIQEMALLSQWLRNEHNTNVIVEVDETSYLKYAYKIIKYVGVADFQTSLSPDLYRTFEEAQLEGLYFALKQIKK